LKENKKARKRERRGKRHRKIGGKTEFPKNQKNRTRGWGLKPKKHITEDRWELGRMSTEIFIVWPTTGKKGELAVGGGRGGKQLLKTIACL